LPFVNVKLVDGVFTSTQKHELAKALTDVMKKAKEAFESINGNPVTRDEFALAAPPISPYAERS